MCCSVLPPDIVMHDAYIGGHSENNIKCIVHDDRAGFLPCHWLCKWFCQLHSCGTNSVLSRSPFILKQFLFIDDFFALFVARQHAMHAACDIVLSNSVSLSVCLSVRLSVSPSVCLSVHPVLVLCEMYGHSFTLFWHSVGASW